VDLFYTHRGGLATVGIQSAIVAIRLLLRFCFDRTKLSCIFLLVFALTWAYMVAVGHHFHMYSIVGQEASHDLCKDW